VKEYDLIVIGAGAGTKISTPAARLGKKVAIIEQEAVGGTCLNRGCIPSKMLIHPANVLTHYRSLTKHYITPGQEAVDFASLVNRINEAIDHESDSAEVSYDSISTLDLYKGEAQFIDNHSVRVQEEVLTAPVIVIAVGSRPSIPPIPGLADTPFMTSKEALRNTTLPKKLIVIGGGYIGTELGHAYQSYGTETVFFVRDCYLSREDKDVRTSFMEEFTKSHKTHFGTSNLAVTYEEGVFTVTGTSETGETISETADALLVATGVASNTDTLGLNNTDIKLTNRGFVAVNDQLKSTVEGVYAIGESAGKFFFRHSANFEGEYLFNHLFGSQEDAREPIKYPPMPHAVFSSPEIAAIGPTEEELKEAGVPYVVGRNEYQHSAQGMARLPEVGFVKLLFHKETQELLAAHIIGEEASIMIHQLIQAMHHKATLDDILAVIYIHPTLPEVVRNAARKAKTLLTE